MIEKTKIYKKIRDETDPEIEEMIKAGVQFGRLTSYLHPKMKEFILGMRGKIHIIDLRETKNKLEEAIDFIKKLISEGKTILLVGTKISARKIIEEIAQECNLPYVTNRWVGGLFTNFENIVKRIERLKELEEKRDKGEFDKYTKKEKILFEREIKRLKEKFEGLKKLDKIPDAVLVIDPTKEKYCVREARKKGIKIIGILNTNSDPSKLDFPIPANDTSISSLEYLLNKIKKAILEVKK